MTLPFKLEKKHKYLIHSLLVGAVFFWFSFSSDDNKISIFMISLVVVSVGTLISQYPNIEIRNVYYNLLIPMHLMVGMMLSIIYFPNLGDLLKITAALVFSFVFYVVLLINNVFMVVEEKKEIIPLYRAAVTWNQILLVVVAIPYLAGVFKMPLNAFIQGLVVTLSIFFLFSHHLWALQLDREVKQLRIGEKWMLIIFMTFLGFIYSITVSFIPTESFLRALFVSTFLIFGVNYLQGHLKNTLTFKLIAEYFILSIIFFLIILIYKP